MNLIELRGGATTVTLAPEAGGRIVQIATEVDGAATPLLVAPEHLQLLIDEPLAWGCYPMAPWPGRVDGSRFSWGGETYELPVNQGPHSIHGRAMYLPWVVRTQTQDVALLEVDLGPEVGWPFASTVRQIIAARGDGVDLTMVRSGGASFPAGVGWHPWFRRDVHSGAAARSVRVPASGWYERRNDLIPTGAVREPEGDADLREGPVLGERRLDDFYMGVAEPMQIGWGDFTLTMRSSANVRHAVVFTGQERGFCVEPQTCAPDSFNLAARGVEGTGVVIVEPGKPLVAETSWRWKDRGAVATVRGEDGRYIP